MGKKVKKPLQIEHKKKGKKVKKPSAHVVPNIKGQKPRRIKDASLPSDPGVIEGKTIEELRADLNDQQVFFCHEYMIDFNGKQAAIRAKYSAHTAEVKASQLLSLVKVQLYLSVLREERRNKATKTVDDIEREMEKIGFANLTDAITFTRDGLTFLKESEDLSDEAKAALESVQFIETQQGISVKVKMRDKIAALKLLGQQKGMFSEKIDHSVTVETYEQKRLRLLGATD